MGQKLGNSSKIHDFNETQMGHQWDIIGFNWAEMDRNVKQWDRNGTEVGHKMGPKCFCKSKQV